MNSFVTRTISGGVLVALIAAALLISPYLFAAVAFFAMLVMIKEFYNMTLGKAYSQNQNVILIGSAALFLIVFAASMRGMLNPSSSALFALICLALTFCYGQIVFKKGVEAGQRYILTEGFTYISIPLSLFSVFVCGGGEFRGLAVLCFFIMIWASDVGAYCVGCTLGRNGKKMCPSISPNKSWWGFFGGLVFAVAAGVIVSLVGWLELAVWKAAILAVLMHLFGVIGDLFESKWKRLTGFKDSGNIIPGHGGLLDRFDSSLFAFPIAILFLEIFG